ncbi:hypothetical protein QR680_016993 [Steinernema hermaphroditum]|uniref:Fe2OG dioxygenase domain-containing protein n=1 Tax=Steinernema hermaphroditum TaxID=289476 RepID=A0AA39HFD7_9BILA|nr:hypothetical protein QR680_016993 [Steinernema hermaphroditum]
MLARACHRFVTHIRFSSMATAKSLPESSSGYESPSEESGVVTEFRKKFKYFKARKVEPDMSTVISLRESDPSRGVECSADFGSSYAPSADELDSVGLKPVEEWTCTTLKHRPGLYVLTDLFLASAHLTWLKRCLLEYAEPPNVTNLTAHHPDLEKGVFQKMANKLRWATLGVDYDWATKVYPEKPRAELPKEMKTVARIVSNVLGLGDMNADAVIVNYYPGKSTLSAHVDRSERDLSRPLVSLSFGQSAVYLTGGTDLDDPVDALYLQSGDVLVMHASQRLVYHAVPRIVKDRKFEGEGCSKELVDYANNNRINITIRQVD